jgi:hypothetical protein
MLLLACLSKTRRVRREAAAAGGDLAPLAEGIEIALVAYAVGGLFGPTGYHFYFYYVAGLAVAAGEIHRRIAGSEGDQPRALRVRGDLPLPDGKLA